jgi:hypothetical protein
VTIAKLDLLENGIDFLGSGIETFFATKANENDPRSHKYALLHLFSGVLLILKERLCRAHISLIFERVEDVGTPTAKTVRFEQLIRRLDVCAGVKLSAAELTLLNRAQHLRNAMEHYRFELNLQSSQRLITALVEFAFLFARRELAVRLEEHLSDEVAERISQLRAILTHLQRESRREWARRARRYRELPAEYLAKLGFGVGLGRYIARIGCAKCSEVEVVVPERDITICRKCRYIRRLQGCMLCGEPASDEGLCEACIEHMDEEDRYRLGYDE